MSIYNTWGPRPSLAVMQRLMPQPVNSSIPMAGATVPAAPQPTLDAFTWGPNGQRIAAGQGPAQPDFSPINHWSQGAARMVGAVGDAMQARRAASMAAGFPDAPRTGPVNFMNPFTAYRKGGGLY